MVRKLVRKECRGVVIVEFALVLPLLLLLTLGAIKYGHLFLKAQLITNAARAGAREAVLPLATDAGVRALIDSRLIAAGIAPNPGYVTITPANAFVPALTGTQITVTITIPVAVVGVLNVPLFPAGGNLGATVTMAKEGP